MSDSENKHTFTAEFVRMTEPQTYGTYTKVEMDVKIVDGQYTNWAVFDVSGKTMDLLLENPPSTGDQLSISFAINGRFSEKHNRTFNGMRAFFIRNLSRSSSQQSPAPQQSKQAAPQPQSAPVDPPTYQNDSEEEVPF